MPKFTVKTETQRSNGDRVTDTARGVRADEVSQVRAEHKSLARQGETSLTNVTQER